MNAIQSFPQEPEPYLQLGNLLAGVGRWSMARKAYAQRCRLLPGCAVSHHNLGVALQELGETTEAITAFERAIELKPRYAAAFYGLGLAYQRLEAFEAALLAFECAQEADPKDPRLPLEHARTRVRMGDLPGALTELDEGLKRREPQAALHNLRGVVLKNLSRADEALAAYDRALALEPQGVEALGNRGNLQLIARRFTLALADMDRALALQPDLDWLPGLRLYAAMHVYDWAGHDAQRSAILEGLAQGRKTIQPLALQCLVDDPQAQLQAARLWAASACPPRREAPASRAREAGEGRIRLAYISRDFRSHPVSFLMAEVFEQHDRERFEIIALNYGPASDDPMQQRLRASFERFLDVGALSDRAIADLARHLEVDVAIDLTGYTEGARSSIFAWRAAPVQIMYLGYLGSSGCGAYDYLLADAQIVPPEAQAAWDERLIILPSYQANDRQRPLPPQGVDRASFGLPEEAFVYCCFNNPCKVTPDQFDRWVEILKQVPNGVLWVLEEDTQAVANLRREAEARGLPGERIHFARRTDRDSYLAALSVADLFLDTLPYNAGTTASDALWVGLPVLTLPGRSFPARVASSLLQAVGLPELIADDARDYVERAVQLAHAPDSLQALRQRLQHERSTCRLFDSLSFTRDLEGAIARVAQA